MVKNEEIQIVYASDDRFAEIMGVSIFSLFAENVEAFKINLHILDCGISYDNKEKIKKTCEQFNRSYPSFIKVKNIDRELGINIETDRGSLSQYARLFISSVLPSELERVIYLDCDVIFNSSILQLWNLDLKGQTIAALMDAFSKCYRVNIGLKPDDIMFNSGVMVIDLIRWRKNEIEQKLLNFIIEKKGKVQQGDQGVLNAVLSKETFCFDPIFNSVTIFYDFNYCEMLRYRKPPLFYSKEQIDNSVKNPVIIHFTTSIFSKRPWVIGCKHKYSDKWKYYKEKSLWKTTPFWEDSTFLLKKKGLDLMKKFPRIIVVFVAGFFQAYGRPILYKLKNK